LPTSKDLPSSLVQLRIAVWTGVTRDTRPTPDSRPEKMMQRSNMVAQRKVMEYRAAPFLRFIRA
jgi:hypothetical protein